LTVKWPALKAVLERHTVETPRGRVAGFLVRCTASRKDLGWVWQTGATGSVWRWRTPDGNHYGERGAQRAAVQVLREIADLGRGGLPLLERLRQQDEQATPAPPPAPVRKPAPVRVVDAEIVDEPAEPPPVKKIVWGTQSPGLSSALAAAFRRQRDE
jgi:hypothetical protein